MLSLLRKNAGSWMIKVLLGAIVLVFVFWGVGSFRERERSRVATVNGKMITLDEYNEKYRTLLEVFRQRFGNELNEEMLKMLQLKKQALNQIIDQRLLLDEAERLNFRVSESELSSAIMKIGAFQNVGIFNARIYQRVLNRNNLTPEKFEVLQRDSMLADKLRSYITSSAKVSDDEAREFFKWQNSSANIDYALFEPGIYEGIYPSTEEIQTFYDNHKARYRTESMVKIRYLNFDSKAYFSRVEITDEEIEEYYETYPEKFKTPKTVDARHILITVDLEATPEKVEETKNKALDILKKARAGNDFADLAKKYSEGPGSKMGGKLGPFRKEAMEKPFSDKAFSMNVGEISEPVRTRYGWHIIKVEKINEASKRSLTEAEKEIRKTLTYGKAKNIAYDEAEDVYDVSFEGDDLVKAGKEHNLSVLTSDFFARREPDKALEKRRKIAEIAFELSVMEISDIIDYGDGYYILQVLEKRPEKISELKDVGETVRSDLIKEKQDEKAKNDADAFLAIVKERGSLVDESKKMDLTTDTTGFFKRNDSIPNIGYEREIAEAAFLLSADKKVPDNVIKGKNGYYVISFKESKEPESEGFDREKEEIKEKLLQQKKQQTFEAMLSQLKSKSEIIIEDRFLE